jgi:hypothetical protein
MRHSIPFRLTSAIAIALFFGSYSTAKPDNGLTITSDLDGTNQTQTVAGDIHIQGKIDGGSTVSLTSTAGSITIDGKIDGGSKVRLQAAGNITIGVVGGDGDKKIDGGSRVTAVSGGAISLGNKIDGCPAPLIVGECTTVTFVAANGITIGNKIDGGVTAVLCTTGGTIHIQDKIDNGNTRVTYWQPNGNIQVDGGIHGGANVNENQSACSPPQ